MALEKHEATDTKKQRNGKLLSTLLLCVIVCQPQAAKPQVAISKNIRCWDYSYLELSLKEM